MMDKMQHWHKVDAVVVAAVVAMVVMVVRGALSAVCMPWM